MAIASLYDAAVELRSIREVLERVLMASAPLQMAYFEERAVMLASRRTRTGTRPRCGLRTGYGPFFDAASDLIGLLESVEEADNADMRRRFEEMPR